MSEEEILKKSTEARESGNKYFKEKNFVVAIDEYTKSIELKPTPQALSNRAFCYIKLDQFGAALVDAEKAIEIDPTFTKAYYRKGFSHFALEKYSEAMQDFKKVLSLDPKSKEARDKFNACKKQRQRIEFEKAIYIEHKPPSQTVNLNGVIPESYDGVKLENPKNVTKEFVLDMLERFKNQKLIPKTYVMNMLVSGIETLVKLPSLVHVEVPKGNKITVCGDTHGQFFDLMNIFKLNGLPSEENPYVFNGDFVDRGSWSCEVILTLLAFKLLYPKGLHMTRGNHESHHMNRVYGFEGEVKHKYNETIYDLFQEFFNLIPLSIVLNHKVMICHGGLFSKDGVTLDDIAKIDRNRDIPDTGIFADIMWADPQKQNGRAPNKRGVSVAFGPDVTKRFLDDNGLELLVRSHETKQEGFEFEADNRLITIFSAPNYCDQMGNKGAYIHFNGDDMKPILNQFSHVPHPNVKPMQYANQMFGGQ